MGLKKKLLSKYLFQILNIYPPYLGAGVKSKKLNKEGTKVLVTMKLSALNANYVGTHFGGSLYSMCDPFYMLMLMQIIGKDYLVWDKSASIEFKKPGKGKVSALFEISPAEVEDILANTKDGKPYEPKFSVDVLDEDQNLVARVEKTLWVKKK
ncbi:hypothetical protein A9Q84_18970 [Halobacteriovorax marinus]|uniref:Tetrameric acyl-CoA thioesterase n=1 Tax=Halobacteriovorax marinus TaxID=97084 RepID=A0A1Y5F2L0_9BACT|nr:hypothetical protein A9Q84_18970 [Halobacteriovorax marinus]